MCPFLFSRKKAKVDALMMVEKSIALELRTFTNHLQTVDLAYDIVANKLDKIIVLLEEKNKNGQ